MTLKNMLPFFSFNVMYQGTENLIIFLGTRFGARGLGSPTVYLSRYWKLSDKMALRTNVSSDILSSHTIMNKLSYRVNESLELKLRMVSSRFLRFDKEEFSTHKC